MRFLVAVAILIGDYVVVKAVPSIVFHLPHESQDKMWGSIVLLVLIVVGTVVGLAWATAPLRRRSAG